MKEKIHYLFIAFVLLATLAAIVKAENASDGVYTIEEAIFGSGLIVNDSNYEVASVFDLDFIGLSTSSDYDVYSGFYNNFNICLEDWSCGAWSDAANSCGTRTCTDANSCGTEYDKPSESLTCPTTGDGGGPGAREIGRQVFFHVFNNELQTTQEVIVELKGPLIVFNDNDYWVLFTVTVDGYYHTLETNPELTLVNPYNDIVLTETLEPISLGSYRFIYDKEDITLDGIWTSDFDIEYLGEILEFEETWLSRSAPTKLSMENVDNTAPEVQCNIKIENEGVYQQEFIYRYWLTNKPGGLFEDAISGGSESKLLQPKESIEKLVTFDVNSLGNYWCKSDVDYGGKISAASASFIVTESDSFIPDFTYVKQKAMEIGGKVYPSQPGIGFVIVLIVVAIILSVLGIIPEEAKKYAKKKFKAFRRMVMTAGDEDEE